MWASREKSHIFATRGCAKQSRRRTNQSGKVNRRSKANPTRQKAIPHLDWNGDKFQKGFPDPPPFLRVSVTPIPEAHTEFGYIFVKTNSFRTHHVIAIADTGVQTCSCGPEIQKALGYPDEYLLPTIHQIRGITEDQLDIRGVMFACIRVGSREARQAVYVSENTSGFYLSESALKKLGLLPLDFPTLTSQQNVAISNEQKASCGCSQRTVVPLKPIDIPFAPTEENRHGLEEWILEHLGNSAFSTSPHQQPQTMKGKHLDINFVPGTKQSAVNTPIPVPHH